MTTIHYVPTAYPNKRAGGFRACLRVIKNGKMIGSAAGVHTGHATRAAAVEAARVAAEITRIALSRVRPDYKVTVAA